MAKYPGVSISVVRRLPRYYRELGDLVRQGAERISSRELADLIGLTASQIRQDLNCFGGFGQQGYGYNVKNLYSEIGDILGLNRPKETIILGAGNLGYALANYMYYEETGFNVAGVFDIDPKKIGNNIGSVTILPVSKLDDFCHIHEPEVAVICVPDEGVEDLVKQLVDNGIKGFWNFSHYDIGLDYPDDISVEHVNLADSLMTLSFQVEELE